VTRTKHRYWLSLPTCVLLVVAAGPVEVDQNPHGAASDIAAGEQLFLGNCSSCHGGNATGGRGPNLRRRPYRNGNDDAQVFAIIQNGLPGMPWNGLADRSVWQIVAYLRSLSPAEVEVAGDPAQGRDLFYGRADCALCHMVNGAGGRQGPDLSWVGWRLAPEALRVALLEPGAEVEPRWWRASASTTAGYEFEGYIIDEDQFTIRLLDGNDALRAFNKHDLARLDKQRGSLMPAFGDLLTANELTDVIAYLAGLTGTESGP
jgi:putative heme-binding domain-containing protein